MTDDIDVNDPDTSRWLSGNRDLRMDANNPLFDEVRRAFHLDRYRFAQAYCQGQRVLDGACGTGYGSALLGTVASEVHGIDLSRDAVAYARQNYARDNVHFTNGCVELTPFDDDYFDVVVSFETIEHTLSPQAALAEFVRVMKPDGQLILSIPNNWGLTAYHFYDFNLATTNELLDKYFKHKELYYNNSGGRKKQQPKGIGRLAEIGPDRAECLLAVCSAPVKEAVVLQEHRTMAVLNEIYAAVFARHEEYRRLYKYRGGRIARFFRRLRGIK